MKQSYFPEDGIWLKGNIHSHSTVSDGALTPEELADGYAERGYDFLSVTDHNMLVAHDELSKNGFLLLNGLEHDIEYSSDKCTHIVGLSADGKSSTSYLCKRYSSEELTDQQLINLMCKDGQFISVAHPVWSRMTWENLSVLEGYNAIEVYNNGTEHLCHGGNAETLWEMLLREGKRIFATAVDDVHVANDLYGGWVCVKAAQRSKAAILEALRGGKYYSSSGPVIHDFAQDGNEVSIACEGCREIHFVTYPPRGKSIFAEGSNLLTEAVYTLTGREAYVRVVCVDEAGRSAWTNPIFFDK